jgi:hypothetical protein
MKDTLFALSLQYKVSKRAIRLINKFEGEDIFFMTEMLIPYRGQSIVLKEPQEVQKDDTETYKTL